MILYSYIEYYIIKYIFNKCNNIIKLYLIKKRNILLMSTTFNNWIFYILLSLFIVLTSMYIEEHQEKLKDEIFKFINFS